MSKLLEKINTARRETKKLGEVFEIIDGDRGANYPSKSEFTKTGYCLFLNTKNVPSQGFDFTNADFISKERDELLRKGKLSRNDIVMTTRGTIGNVAVYTENFPFDCVRINSGMVVLRTKQEYDRTYLYTLIKSSLFNTRLKNTSSGSAQPQLPIKDLREIEIEIPNFSVQKKIAEILSAYDEKIENNNKIIKNLETTAQTIFKEWFVSFHFPGYEKIKMIDSEIGEIPQEWKTGRFTDFIDVLGGGTPPTTISEYWNGDIPFFTPKDVDTGFYCLSTEKKITEIGLRKCNSILYPKNTVFITARGTVGKLALSGVSMAMNQSCYALRGKDGLSTVFVLLLTQNLIKGLQQVATGGVFDTITTSTFENTQVLIPPSTVLVKFDILLNSFFEEILNLANENIELKALRDRLLMKLI